MSETPAEQPDDIETELQAFLASPEAEKIRNAKFSKKDKEQIRSRVDQIQKSVLHRSIVDGYTFTEYGDAQRLRDLMLDHAFYLPSVDGSGTWLTYDDLDGLFSRREAMIRLRRACVVISAQYEEQVHQARTFLETLVSGAPLEISLHVALNDLFTEMLGEDYFRNDLSVAIVIDVLSGLIKHNIKRATMLLGGGYMSSVIRTTGILLVGDDSLFDTHSHLLAVRNGVVNLRTGELLPFDRHLKLTVGTDVSYDSKAKAPTFQRFLDRILPDKDVQKYVLRTLGYALTGLSTEQVMFVLHGSGANGKSLLMEIVRNIMGPDVSGIVPKSLIVAGRNGNNSDSAQLVGKRMATLAELEEEDTLYESSIKEITGGDMLLGRFLYRQYFQFEPQHTLFMLVNHIPPIKGDDFGIRRRFVVIPFSVQIAPEEQDPDLKSKIMAEAPGVLRMLVDGAVDYYANGLKVLPDVIAEATGKFRGVDARVDVIAKAVFSHFVADPHGKVLPKDVMAVVEDTCKRLKKPVPTATELGRWLTEHGFPVASNKRHRLGLTPR